MKVEEMPFDRWLELKWRYGGRQARMDIVSMVAIFIGTAFLFMFEPFFGGLLFGVMIAAFYAALRRAYRQDLQNPPWYLKVESHAVAND